MYDFNKSEFSQEDVSFLLKSGFAIDGKAGGLLLGRDHDTGGIPVLQLRGEKYIRDIEVEGYEFVFNSGAAYIFESYFDYLNQPVDGVTSIDFCEYLVPDEITIIDARHMLGSKFLIITEFATLIFNKHATKGFLKTLNEMNLTATVDDKSEIQILHAKPVDIYFYDQFCGSVIGKR